MARAERCDCGAHRGHRTVVITGRHHDPLNTGLSQEVDVGRHLGREQDEPAKTIGERRVAFVGDARIQDVTRSEGAARPTDEDAGAIRNERWDFLLDGVDSVLEERRLHWAGTEPIGLVVAGRVSRRADQPATVTAGASEPIADRRGFHAGRVQYDDERSAPLGRERINLDRTPFLVGEREAFGGTRGRRRRGARLERGRESRIRQCDVRRRKLRWAECPRGRRCRRRVCAGARSVEEEDCCERFGGSSRQATKRETESSGRRWWMTHPRLCDEHVKV